MNKLLRFITFSIFTTLSLLAGKALAAGGADFFQQGIVGADSSTPGITAITGAGLGSKIVIVINYFLGLLGLVAVAFLIYAGILMVTAGGDDGAIGKGKKIITYAVIGIVIILLSYTIVTFVSNALNK